MNHLMEHKMLGILLFVLITAVGLFGWYHYASMEDEDRPRWIW